MKGVRGRGPHIGRLIKHTATGTAALLYITLSAAALAAPISVVAAENFYGDVAKQIGGPGVLVASILTNPDIDPHLFQVSPSIARILARAQVVIYNGIGYDAWATRLLPASADTSKTVIVVARLTGKKDGDNLHIWYDPSTMLALATALADDFSRIDPAGQALYHANLTRFHQSIQLIENRIIALRSRLAGEPVTATEPVADYLLQAIGLKVLNPRFQLAIMNDTEPSPSDVATFERDLRTHKVRLLIYNSQATEPLARRMLDIARESAISIVGVTETEPPGKTYQEWLMSELDAISQALLPR